MKKYFLILILILAAVLRFYGLSHFPSGLNADEAALGYNAYSLLLTGKDEHGHPWPVNLESFGDFKPALYAYILIPFVKVLGLNVLAVRLPSAIAGVASVFLIYLLVVNLSSNPSPGSGEGNQRREVVETLGLLSALFLAISPWHLHFSRGAWEANVATMFILFSIWSFLRWLKNHSVLSLGLCALGFVLSMYTYQSARVIAPLLGLGLALIYFKNLIRYPKHILLAILTLTLTLTPLIISVVHSNAASRLSGVGLFADIGPINRVNELRGQYSARTQILGKIFHNRASAYLIRFLDNYTSHFSGDFLFVSGDGVQRSKVPETGLLYLTDFIFITLGIIYLLRRPNFYIKIIWLWLLIAPVASALTFQTPSALRAQNLVIPLTIILALGFYYFVSRFRQFKLLVIILIILIYTYQFARYLHQYYVHYPQFYPAAWEYGFDQVSDYINTNSSRYQRVLVTNKYDQPYILFLFFSAFPPGQFQGHHQLTFRDQFNFSTVNNFDKYTFTDTSWDKVRDIHSALIIAAPEDIPPVGVNIVKTIYFPGGTPAFKIISN